MRATRKKTAAVSVRVTSLSLLRGGRDSRRGEDREGGDSRSEGVAMSQERKNIEKNMVSFSLDRFELGLSEGGYGYL